MGVTVMSNFNQADSLKIQNEIQKIEESLKSIQKEAVEIQKQLDALRLVIHDSSSTDNKGFTISEPVKMDSFPTPVDIMNYKPYLSLDGSIKYKTSTKVHNIPAEVVKMALETKTLKAFFQAFSLQIKDNRAKGGALWVKGDADSLEPYICIACRKFACGGKYTSNGNATGYQIGWFTHCRR